MRNTQNPEVFLDISIGGDLAERIEIEGGDFSEENGTGGESIYGIPFFDGGSESKHKVPYLLTTANDYHKYTIGSCFFITFNELHELDGKHVVFRRVVRGYDTVQKMEQVQTFPDGKPERVVIITACGVSPKNRSLHSIIIRGDSSLLLEERHSRKRRSKGDRIVEYHSDPRHHRNQRSQPNQSCPRHYRSKSREKNSPGWNYAGGGNSVKNSAPRHSRSNSRDRTSKEPRCPIQKSDAKHSPPRHYQSNSRDRTSHQWQRLSETSDAKNPPQQQYTSKRGRSRKKLRKALGSHTQDQGHSKQQNHSPDPEKEFLNLSKSMQMRLCRPGDNAQP